MFASWFVPETRCIYHLTKQGVNDKKTFYSFCYSTERIDPTVVIFVAATLLAMDIPLVSDAIGRNFAIVVYRWRHRAGLSSMQTGGRSCAEAREKSMKLVALTMARRAIPGRSQRFVAR